MSPNVRIQCVNPFFIAFMGRSGSTHLLHLLNQHPDIMCFNEFFNVQSFWGKGGRRLNRKIKRIIKQLMGRDRLVKYYLSKVYQASSPACRGVEVNINGQFDAFPEVYQWLKENSNKVKCIFLSRENNLRGALSKQNFKRIKKKYHSANIEQDRDVHVEFLDVDIDLAVQETQKREKLNELYSKRLSREFDTHHILYEDLVANEMGTLNGCFEFLHAKTISDGNSFKHKTQRISANRIRDYVSNFDELHRRLKKENLEHYIEMDERR
jgi:Txe/YoeB family toxin of Txe-Axe toxin-antitoxin module